MSREHPPHALLHNVSVPRIVRALKHEGFQFTERQGSERGYRHADGRRIITHYHRPNDSLTPYVIRHLLVSTCWTEADLRRLELIK